MQPIIFLGKSISKISRSLNRGNGSTWPGHIALNINKNFIQDVLSKSNTKIIIVAGTNGKSTTSSMIKAGLDKTSKTVVQNESGANLLNGIASTILLNSDDKGRLPQDIAIFEVDENALLQVLKQITPDYLVLLNLFRDQLDRYGEINTIADNWQKAISNLPKYTKLVLNADDPQIASIPYFLNIPEKQTLYFGLQNNKANTKQPLQAADSVSCPKCSHKLTFETISYSHLGKWKCTNCKLQQPKPDLIDYDSYPLSGTYNKYNTHAAVLVLKDLGITHTQIKEAFENFSPVFGRQEIIPVQEKKVQLFLSKNPTSFNQSFLTIKDLNGQILLLILNDRIPDGRDVSWIWDTDMANIEKFRHILLSGDRVYDLALRLKYELGTAVYDEKVLTFEKLKDAIETGIKKTNTNETFYILPTYSAMLDTRKILTGKKIL
jgi:UDP-N-acetylmuramyl tripeptide synthase